MDQKEKLASQEKPRPLETFEEKLDFLMAAFVLHTRELRDTDEAEVTFGGDLFVGEIDPEISGKIQNGLGVSLGSKPDFRLNGKFEFNVWLVPKSEPELYLLKREIEGETEILAYEGNLLQIFEEAENLTRI